MRSYGSSTASTPKVVIPYTMPGGAAGEAIRSAAPHERAFSVQLANASGAVTLARSYDPYGNVLTSMGSGTTNYNFASEWRDYNAYNPDEAGFVDGATSITLYGVDDHDEATIKIYEFRYDLLFYL